MTADAWVVHDDFKHKEGNKEIDLDGDGYEVRLAASTSNVSDSSVSDASAVTDELSGNGYAAQPFIPTWVQSGANSTFGGASVAFPAAGGSLAARFAYLVNTSLTPELVVAHCLLDNTPDDVTAVDGQSLRVNFPSGLFVKS